MDDPDVLIHRMKVWRSDPDSEEALEGTPFENGLPAK
jgi:hypothetical protein